MQDLNFEVKNLAEAHSKDIGATSLRDRRYALGRMATLLEGELGYRGLQAANLKMRHVNALLGYWQREELSVGTMKNNLVHLRFWAEAVGKRGMIPADNRILGVGYRQHVTNEDRSRTLDAQRLERVDDDRVRMALMLQAAFGLRREEAIKFDARYADLGDRIRLKATWCKGGRARQVPITSPVQRELLDRVKGRVEGSLIRSGRTYAVQRERYMRECRRVGFDRMHGLRHGYAHRRYEELTGRPCPAVGGPHRKDLRGRDRTVDREARKQISAEMGHGRIEVVAIYCGA